LRERLRRLDSLCSAAATGAESLAPDAPDGAGGSTLPARAGAEIGTRAGVGPRLDAAGERVRAIAIEADDLARELRAYAEDSELERGGASEQTLDGVEGRLAAIERLMRKHGGEIAGVLAHAATARARRDEIAGAE